MYDLIDRPVATLSLDQRSLLMRVRRWVHAMMLAGDAAEDRADPFDIAMRLIDRHSADDLEIARPCGPLVGESEAVLLSLWRLVRDGERVSARGVAVALVGSAASDLTAAVARA